TRRRRGRRCRDRGRIRDPGPDGGLPPLLPPGPDGGLPPLLPPGPDAARSSLLPPGEGGAERRMRALHLVCPRCRAALPPDGPCAACGAPWSTEEGLRVLYEDADVRGNDRLLRHIYDRLAPLHDPAVRVLIPL